MDQMIFTRDKPAEHIEYITDYLINDEPEKYVFRGQHTHYPNLIPSSYRGVVSAVAQNEPLVPVDSKKMGNWEERRRLKFHLLNRLIGEYGRAFGNLFSQQYGLSSEAIDITDDPRIAAFFATRSYPKYDAFKPENDDALGVIYRFPRVSQPPNVPHFELLLEMIGAVFTDLNVPGKVAGWFTKRIKIDEIEKWNIDLSKYFALFGKATGQLSTLAIFADCEQLNKLYGELCQKTQLPKTDLAQTRISCQKGGVIRVPVHWQCEYPMKIQLLPVPNTNTIYLCYPNVAIMHKLIAVENGFWHPAIRSYFFKHKPEKIPEDFSPDQLWPSITSDKLYDWICRFALNDKYVIRYLDRVGCEVTDIIHGIIDPGFQK